jgi:hypothetical protein
MSNIYQYLFDTLIYMHILQVSVCIYEYVYISVCIVYYLHVLINISMYLSSSVCICRYILEAVRVRRMDSVPSANQTTRNSLLLRALRLPTCREF